MFHFAFCWQDSCKEYPEICVWYADISTSYLYPVFLRLWRMGRVLWYVVSQDVKDIERAVNNGGPIR